MYIFSNTDGGIVTIPAPYSKDLLTLATFLIDADRISVDTEILSASIRNVGSVSKSFEYGAGIVTMPPSVFEKMYNHILTDKGLELFQKDWEAVNVLKF